MPLPTDGFALPEAVPVRGGVRPMGQRGMGIPKEESDLAGDMLVLIAHAAGIAVIFVILAAVMWSAAA